MRDNCETTSPALPEPYFTLKDAAKRLGLPYFKLQRAARIGVFPTHRLLNHRPLVRLSEIVEAIEGSRAGGGESRGGGDR